MGDVLLPAEREAVANASHHLAETGLVIGTAGNVSSGAATSSRSLPRDATWARSRPR